jgi:hypothetical protein
MLYRSWLGTDLAPHERALVRFLEGLVGAVLLAVSTVGLQYLSGIGVDGVFDLKVFGGLVLLAAWQACIKYARAHADIPLGAQPQPNARPASAIAAKADAWANDTNPPIAPKAVPAKAVKPVGGWSAAPPATS